MLQEHQQRSLLRTLRVSINTAFCLLMWIDPEIRAQLGISNLCYVDFLAPVVSKVNAHLTCLHVMVGEFDSEEKWGNEYN